MKAFLKILPLLAILGLTSSYRIWRQADGCQGREDFEKYPNSQDCRQFFQCYRGESHLIVCPEGTYFNDAISNCQSQLDTTFCELPGDQPELIDEDEDNDDSANLPNLEEPSNGDPEPESSENNGPESEEPVEGSIEEEHDEEDEPEGPGPGNEDEGENVPEVPESEEEDQEDHEPEGPGSEEEAPEGSPEEEPENFPESEDSENSNGDDVVPGGGIPESDALEDLGPENETSENERPEEVDSINDIPDQPVLNSDEQTQSEVEIPSDEAIEMREVLRKLFPNMK